MPLSLSFSSLSLPHFPLLPLPSVTCPLPLPHQTSRNPGDVKAGFLSVCLLTQYIPLQPTEEGPGLAKAVGWPTVAVCPHKVFCLLIFLFTNHRFSKAQVHSGAFLRGHYGIGNDLRASIIMQLSFLKVE